MTIKYVDETILSHDVQIHQMKSNEGERQINNEVEKHWQMFMQSGYKSRKMLQCVKLFLHELKSESSLLTQIKCLTFGANNLSNIFSGWMLSQEDQVNHLTPEILLNLLAVKIQDIYLRWFSNY